MGSVDLYVDENYIKEAISRPAYIRYAGGIGGAEYLPRYGIIWTGAGEIGKELWIDIFQNGKDFIYQNSGETYEPTVFNFPIERGLRRIRMGRWLR